MATVTGYTAARMLEIENASVVDGDVVGNNLILTTRGGTQINAGSVQGPVGPPGPGMTTCTSSTRPTHLVGREIYETDTGKVYLSNGTAWIYLEGPGDMRPWMAAAVPTSWLFCAGQSLLRASYPLLFAVLDVTYGTVDGTHFTLPDLRGRQLTGLDNMGGTDAGRLTALNTLGGSGGEEGHVLVEAELATHSHVQNPHNHPQVAHAHNGWDGGHAHAMVPNYGSWEVAGALAMGNGSDAVGGVGTATAVAQANIGIDAQNANIYETTAINQNIGLSTRFNVMDPYMLVNWIIRAF